MPISISTDTVHPAERHAFWTESIGRTFAPVETRPLGSAEVSGRFEFVEIGRVKLVRFDSSPQCYIRDAKLVSHSGSEEFMFDFQRRGSSTMVQGKNEGAIAPGFGVLYDARRPFEDRLYGEGQHSEVLIATVPAAALLHAFPQAELLCARPIPLQAAVARAIRAFIRGAIDAAQTPAAEGEADIVAYVTALLRMASGGAHQLGRSSLFGLFDTYLKANIAAIRPAGAIAAGFGVSERTFHRVFADRDTTFERHVLCLRTELLRKLLREASLSQVSIAALASLSGFADGAHATRTFKAAFGTTPRDYRFGSRNSTQEEIRWQGLRGSR
jgi:AraC family transcriptional regulator, positive regulator of tynA and feaB